MTLYRPHDDRIIAGVCSGIARRFNLDPTIVRILFVASLFLPGPQILIYLAAWLLMPVGVALLLAGSLRRGIGR